MKVTMTVEITDQDTDDTARAILDIWRTAPEHPTAVRANVGPVADRNGVQTAYDRIVAAEPKKRGRKARAEEPTDAPEPVTPAKEAVVASAPEAPAAQPELPLVPAAPEDEDALREQLKQ